MIVSQVSIAGIIGGAIAVWVLSFGLSSLGAIWPLKNSFWGRRSYFTRFTVATVIVGNLVPLTVHLMKSMTMVEPGFYYQFTAFLIGIVYFARACTFAHPPSGWSGWVRLKVALTLFVSLPWTFFMLRWSFLSNRLVASEMHNYNPSVDWIAPWTIWVLLCFIFIPLMLLTLWYVMSFCSWISDGFRRTPNLDSGEVAVGVGVDDRTPIVEQEETLRPLDEASFVSFQARAWSALGENPSRVSLEVFIDEWKHGPFVELAKSRLVGVNL